MHLSVKIHFALYINTNDGSAAHSKLTVYLGTLWNQACGAPCMQTIKVVFTLKSL